jgi:FkbM family methyltransferase
MADGVSDLPAHAPACGKDKVSIKDLVKAGFHRMGYDIRKRLGGFHEDANADLKLLTKGRKVETVFDLGANVGWVSLTFEGLFPHATIYAFEPFEETFNTLSERCRGHERIRPNRMAVTDLVGQKRFFFNKFNATNSLLPASAGSGDYVDPEWMAGQGSVEVPTTTLRHFCADRQIDRIQILKMDIQGGELMALQGASPLLEAGAIDLIYTEVMFAELYEGQASFIDLCRFLEPFGYVLYGLYDLNYGKKTGVLAWADAIFISPEIRRSLGRD